MTMRRTLVVSLMMALIALAGCAHPVYYAPGPPPPPAYRQAAHEGYHDGVIAARRDVARGMRPDVNRHPRFRRPPVPPPAINAYRNAFRDGYRDVFRNAVRNGY